MLSICRLVKVAAKVTMFSVCRIFAADFYSYVGKQIQSFRPSQRNPHRT